MKTENKIVIILFLMAFSTLFLLYAVMTTDDASRIAGENAVIPAVSDIGKTVYAEGVVMSRRMTFKGEHLIIQIECADHTVLPVFIPKSAGASSIYSKINEGYRIGVKGQVEEYNGTLEIVLRNEKDFHILS